MLRGCPSPGNLDKLGWFVLSLALSIFSYFLIEQAFRNRRFIGVKPFFLSITAMASVIVGLSFFGEPARLAWLSKADQSE